MEPKISVMPSEDKGIDKRFLKLPHHEILFPPPYTAVILGAIGAGKTSLGYTRGASHSLCLPVNKPN